MGRHFCSPQQALDLLSHPDYAQQDQWQVQIQAQIQLRNEVFVYSDNLSDEQIREALFTPCRSVETTLAQLQAALGPRLAVMPDGPQTVAYVESPVAATVRQ